MMAEEKNKKGLGEVNVLFGDQESNEVSKKIILITHIYSIHRRFEQK